MKYSLTVAALAAAATVVSAAPVSQIERRAGQQKFSLAQSASGHKAAKNGPAALAKAIGKYNKPVPSDVQAAAAASSASATATPSDGDEEYTVPVQVGDQTLQLDFDTGSSDLWVFSTETQGDTSGHTLYDTSSGSLEDGESWNISYGDGSGASGNVYADHVAVGAVTATSQAVEAATSVSGNSFSGSDGLLGLASSSINTVTPNQATTWFDTVKNQLAADLFTATLKHQAPGSYDFGYIDDSKYSGSITYADVDFSQGYWKFSVDGYSVSGQSGSFGDAIADTGTTLIVTDNNDFLTSYYNQVDGATQEQGSYVFPCSSNTPDLTLTIGGNDVTVPGSLINFGQADNNGNCYGGIQSAGSEQLGFTILGDVFLKAVYAVFDEGNTRVGFAPQA